MGLQFKHMYYEEGDWYKHFKDRVENAGCAAPTSLFGTALLAGATINTLGTALETLGATTTTLELMGATTILERNRFGLTVAGSYYVGVLVASFMYATERMIMGKGYNASTLQVLMAKHKLNIPQYRALFDKHPEIFRGQAEFVGGNRTGEIKRR